MNDPISDMLSRVRNASAVNKKQVVLPHSQIKEDIAKIIAKGGFIQDVTTGSINGRKTLTIDIANADKPALISHIRRISRPGQRVYVQAKEIPTIKRGRGIVVMSTSQGIMTGNDAVAKCLGGELICEVY